MEMVKKVTNKQFSQEDSQFLVACNRSATEPTTRQASKWRNRKGKAWKNKLKKEEGK